jgi:hypothetical protein
VWWPVVWCVPVAPRAPWPWAWGVVVVVCLVVVVPVRGLWDFFTWVVEWVLFPRNLERRPCLRGLVEVVVAAVRRTMIAVLVGLELGGVRVEG